MPTLAIIAPDDRPVFEITFPQAHSANNVVVEQLVLHSSLDVVDEKVGVSLSKQLANSFSSKTFSGISPLTQSVPLSTSFGITFLLKMWDTRDMYLKVVDRFNDQLISAFVTASSKNSASLIHIKHFAPRSFARLFCGSNHVSSDHRFLLLHEPRQEDGVKPFFSDLHDLFIKATLNPLYVDSEPIKSTAFHDRVLVLVRKYL